MRWPTEYEKAVGVFLLILMAAACMALLAAFISSDWYLNFYLRGRAIWDKTFQRALTESVREREAREAREQEIDGLLMHLRERDQAIKELQAALLEQEARTAEERSNHERTRTILQRTIDRLEARLDGREADE